jgi:hypothetical protein
LFPFPGGLLSSRFSGRLLSAGAEHDSLDLSPTAELAIASSTPTVDHKNMLFRELGGAGVGEMKQCGSQTALQAKVLHLWDTA